MTKKNKGYDMSSVGGRLKFFREKAKLTQLELGKEVHASRQLVAQWERNERDSYIGCIDDICKTLQIDAGILLYGVSNENQTVYEQLGLSNDSIEFLKKVNANKDVPFTDAIYNADFVGMVDGEGNSNSLIIKTLNLILSTNCGYDMLQAIGNFCFGDFDKGFPVFDNETPVNKIAPVDSFGDPIPAESIRFNVNGIREGCNISMDLMKFALIKAIENYVSQLRENAKGVE